MKKLSVIICALFAMAAVCLSIFYGAKAYGYKQGFTDAQDYLVEQSRLNSTGEGDKTVVTRELYNAYSEGYWNGFFDSFDEEDLDSSRDNPYYGIIYKD